MDTFKQVAGFALLAARNTRQVPMATIDKAIEEAERALDGTIDSEAGTLSVDEALEIEMGLKAIRKIREYRESIEEL